MAERCHITVISVNEKMKYFPWDTRENNNRGVISASLDIERSWDLTSSEKPFRSLIRFVLKCYRLNLVGKVAKMWYNEMNNVRECLCLNERTFFGIADELFVQLGQARPLDVQHLLGWGRARNCHIFCNEHVSEFPASSFKDEIFILKNGRLLFYSADFL